MSRRHSTSPCVRRGWRYGRWSSATRPRCGSSARPACAASADDEKSTTEPIRKRLAKYPTLEFKLDPENDWDQALIDEIAELAPVRVLDLKGLYRGTPVDVETDPELYKAVAEEFEDAYLEDPDLDVPEAREVLEPHGDRVTWDAPLHSLDDVKRLARKAINSKPSRFGSLKEIFSIYDYCDANGIAIYSGGQGEQQCGRGQVQYLASLFHPTTPNDIAPSGLQRPVGALGDAFEPDGPGPKRGRFSLGRGLGFPAIPIEGDEMADKKTFAAALNDQIANEFSAAMQYIGAAVYYDAETLPRLASFFYRQALEERSTR